MGAHYCWVVNADSSSTIYVNGVVEKDLTTAPWPESHTEAWPGGATGMVPVPNGGWTHNSLGGNGYVENHTNFKGSMAHVVFGDGVAFTAEEVTNLYNRGADSVLYEPGPKPGTA